MFHTDVRNPYDSGSLWTQAAVLDLSSPNNMVDAAYYDVKVPASDGVTSTRPFCTKDLEAVFQSVIEKKISPLIDQLGGQYGWDAKPRIGEAKDQTPPEDVAIQSEEYAAASDDIWKEGLHLDPKRAMKQGDRRKTLNIPQDVDISPLTQFLEENDVGKLARLVGTFDYRHDVEQRSWTAVMIATSIAQTNKILALMDNNVNGLSTRFRRIIRWCCFLVVVGAIAPSSVDLSLLMFLLQGESGDLARPTDMSCADIVPISLLRVNRTCKARGYATRVLRSVCSYRDTRRRSQCVCRLCGRPPVPPNNTSIG